MPESLPGPLKEPSLEPWHDLALQGSEVARSRGKVPRLHQDPKDASFQGSRIQSRLQGSKKRFQGSKVPGLQDLPLQVFPSFVVPGFNDT